MSMGNELQKYHSYTHDCTRLKKTLSE